MGRWFESNLLYHPGQLMPTSHLPRQQHQHYRDLNFNCMNKLLQVSLRQQAIFIPVSAIINSPQMLTPTTSMLVANLAQSGFGVSEELLNALNKTVPAYHATILETVQQVMGLHKNWTPLVKGWNIPTGESVIDHIITFFVNIFQARGTKLPCGHIIPANTFPLERYNGCPFCGTPFQMGKLENFKQGSTLKILELWLADQAHNFLQSLLTSKTALDATQTDSLKLLLAELPLPEVKIAIKETAMVIIEVLAGQGKWKEAQAFFSSPTDILRYLWYRHTGFLQLVEPKTIIQRKTKNNRHLNYSLDKSAGTPVPEKLRLRLKYTRKDCLMAASWLNGLDMDAAKICELMHPKRSMWARFIRALRLAEYSKRNGFEKLKHVLHKFYNRDYQVWQGEVNQHRLRYNAAAAMHLLQQRPGLFARSLFANMLWFGNDSAVPAFAEVIDTVPARLVLTLDMVADNYFNKDFHRSVKPLGGISKSIPANSLLKLYSDGQLEEMKAAIRELCILAVRKRFAAASVESRTIYIDPLLFKIPVSIGDRSDNVQDLSATLMGTRFPVEGDTVRLFMQWGNGLQAQHLDMDLSCHTAYPGGTEICSFSRLTATGCKHSGDIRSIPDQAGTAEYIDLDLHVLQQASARYVTFTCNAYSTGTISPNLVIGWMNSAYPMQISETSGVAYDPSCVQHQVRITNTLAKGLVFGVLDVQQKEIIWLEMPFGGQLVQNMNVQNTEALIRKLNNKLSIGRLLAVKAEAQQLQLVDHPDADEAYTRTWAADHAAVTRLLID